MSSERRNSGEDFLNIVYGILDDLYKSNKHHLVTATYCTTNCLAPVLKVVNQTFWINHASIATLHDLTNTQVIVDTFKPDLRRARS